MKKIPTLFVRDDDDRRHVTRDVTPGCEWVLAGEGVATRKVDGTCVMFDGEHWWARREVKPGKEPPANWVEVDHDDTTGKRVGWEPVGQGPFAKPMMDALVAAMTGFTPGTYELCGPKINGNPERLNSHHLHRHGDIGFASAPRDFDGISAFLAERPGVEGIVWHHPDGRMVKIKRRDFV